MKENEGEKFGSELQARRQIHWWYQHNRALAARLLVKYLRPGIRGLDAGATAGTNAAWISAFGELATISPDLDSLAIYRGEVPAVKAALAIPGALPFASCSFDVIVAISVIHDWRSGEPRSILDEFARVLKPGGAVCLIEPTWIPRSKHFQPEGRFVSLPFLAGISEAAGLVLEKQTHANLAQRFQGLIEPRAVRLGSPEVTVRDLTWGRRYVRNALWFLAALERTFLISHDLRAGASAVVVARKPGDARL